jgi:hypothetical protein
MLWRPPTGRESRWCSLRARRASTAGVEGLAFYRDRLGHQLLWRTPTSAGVVVVEPFDIPVGRVAVVADPFGNPLTIVDLTKGRYKTDADGYVTGVA